MAMSEDELSIENLTLCCEGVTQRSHPSRGYGYTRTKAIPSPTSSPATHTGSCITAPTHPSSSPTISTYQFNLGRRHASVNGFSNIPTLSDSTRHSPASKPAPYSASAVASTLSRYRHGRNASLDLIDPIHHQLDFASVKFTHRTTSSDTPSSPINPRPVSRQFLPRPRPHTRGNSIYSCRVPTQILINNLIAQLERELAAYDSAPDRWAHFKAIKSALLELEAAQADGQFPPVEVTAAQFRRRFDHMVLWLEGAHAQRLARDAAEKARRAETGGADPFHHLTGDFRRLALQGAHPFLLPPHTYPAELPLFHVEPVHSNERGWGLQLIEDVKFGAPVLQIPNHLIMSSSSAVFHPKVAEVVAGREVFFQYNALLRLTLRLLVESLDGYLSPFHSYIATLPPTPWSPLAYKADLMEPYRKALTTVEIMEHTRHVTRLYHTIYKHLGVTTFLNRNTFTWAAFRWAYSTVLSRAVALPLPTPSLLGANVRGGIQEYGLVPMVDLVNFSPTGPMPLYNPTTACLEIVASAPLAAGSEVRPSNRLTVQLFVRWPILNNRELLLRYGVCSDRLLANDALRLTVSLPAVNRDAESWERYVLCQSIRVPSSNAFPLHRAPVARTSRELLQYILLVALDVETLRQVTSRAELRPAPGRPFLRDRAQALRHLDATLGEPPAEGGGVAPATPALRTALSWLRVTLQVHLRLALRVDLDALLRPLDLGDPSTYPTRWFLQALRHEQRFVRTAIDEFAVLLGGKSILDD